MGGRSHAAGGGELAARTEQGKIGGDNGAQQSGIGGGEKKGVAGIGGAGKVEQRLEGNPDGRFHVER
jgi:hypothetical protein